MYSCRDDTGKVLTHLLKLLIILLNDNSQVEIFTTLTPDNISFILLHLSSLSLAVLSLEGNSLNNNDNLIWDKYRILSTQLLVPFEIFLATQTEQM